MDELIAKLPTADQARVRADIEALRAKQRAAIARAIDTALAQLPWVMRGPVRKILFP